MADETLFDIKEESKLNEAIPLVAEPYTYENMVNNPIIKPIAECDRSLRDLDEMIYKKLIDIKRLKEKINATITDVPSYQDTTFISELIRLTQSMDDVIKLQDIQFANTKDCIKKVAGEVNDRYWIKLENKEEYVEPTAIIPEGSVEAYLDKMIADERYTEIAKSIKEIFLKTTKGKDEKEKFNSAGLEYYGKEPDKGKRKIAAQMIRMEL